MVLAETKEHMLFPLHWVLLQGKGWLISKGPCTEFCYICTKAENGTEPSRQ